MEVEVKVPQLSESVSEATLVSWRKKAGEAVKRDENLIDTEGKATVAAPATDKGARGQAASGAQAEAKAPAAASSGPASSSASPSARKIAAEKGVDTAQVQGTGR